MKMHCNSCDGIYRSFDVHFTSACDNKCAHCIDKQYEGSHICKPDVNAIVETIVKNQEGMEDVLFLGGEPCLYLKELYACVRELKERTNLKLYITTSVPKTCYDNYELFCEIIKKVDGINLSVQHYDETIADFIRGTSSQYDRQRFYAGLPYKSKIRININLVNPYLSTQEDITQCLKHYDSMGFNTIKLGELQQGYSAYASFEKAFGIKLGSPYANGCQTYLDMKNIIPNFKTRVLLKRSCFLCEETLKARPIDGIKVIAKLLSSKEGKHGVVWENGNITGGWA